MRTVYEYTQQPKTLHYINQTVAEKTPEAECIMAVEKFRRLVNKQIEVFRTRKIQEIRTLALPLLIMGSRKRIEVYRKIFSLQETAELAAAIRGKVNDCLPVGQLWGENPTRLNLQGLNAADDLLLNLKKTLFIKECSRWINGLAWDQAVSCLKLPVAGKRVLRKVGPSSYMAAELSAEELRRMENRITTALTGVLDNMLVDLKEQLHQQIVGRFYGRETKTTACVSELARKIS